MMARISLWRACARRFALALSCGVLVAFPGCGNHWYDYAFNAWAGFLSSQAFSGFLPQ